MRRHLVLPWLLTSSLATTSCVTNTAKVPEPQAKTSRPGARPLAKEGQKVVPSPAAAAQAPALEPTFKRLVDLSVQLQDADIKTASRLYPASPASLEEATLVAAQLRLLRLQIEHKGAFEARDLNPSEGSPRPAAQPSSATVSMERPFDDLQLDLLSILANNPHLQTLEAMRLVKDVFERSSSRPEFAAKLSAMLDAAAQRWSELAPQRPAEPVAPPPSPSSTASAETPAEETSPPLDQVQAEDVKTAATDLKRSDSVLMQAQRLADKGEFKQAIEQAARIESQDPFFEQAREKIKVYSNRAVQDLRQQAAQAFQNAMPLNDLKARENYLLQARQLLERAIQDYPAADQLDRVRENLAVITQNLESLAKDVAPGSSRPRQ